MTTKIYSFGDFLNTYHTRVEAVNLNVLFKRMIFEGLLIDRGGDWEHNPRNATFQTVNFHEHLASYGVYDFLIDGFPLIRTTFTNSVFLFLVKLSENNTTVGTGFLLEYKNHKFVVTAKHNVEKNNGFRIEVPGIQTFSPTEVWITQDNEFSSMRDSLIDIAIIKVKESDGFKAFQIDTWKVLDGVLTIGYPPIPGFDAIQFAETATIAALKSTTGEITGEGNSYIGRQDYYLISARVKGGNSGGPVLNKVGKVVGMIADSPEENNQMDTMGYGVVTPVETIQKFLDSIDSGEKQLNVINVPVTQHGEWWKIELTQGSR